MHLPLLSVLSLFSLVLPSLGSLADIFEIRSTLSDYAIIIDQSSPSGDYSALSEVLTSDVAFDFGANVGVVQGLTNVIATFTKAFKKGIITQNAVTTKSVSLSERDARGIASTISYDTETFFGRGNLSDQIDTIYVRFDDRLVKTNQTGNGGWRIFSRRTTYFVRQASSIFSDACNKLY